MKRVMNLIVLICFYGVVVAQPLKTENVVVITMDGLRWQEVFTGADSLLSFDTAATYHAAYVREKFWAATAEQRRGKLMPFLWNTVASGGLLLGNRMYGNHFNNANPYWFSYPGYNEIVTGFPDTAVNSNDKIPNKNESVFEFLNKKPAFKNRVAVFGSWDVFASIFNEKRSGLLVNDGFRDLQGPLSEQQQFYNRLQHELPDLFHGGERLDAATFHIAFEYFKINKPRLLFIGFGDTDEFAHAGKYDYYLDAANKCDAFIRNVWEYLQSDPQYKGKTTFIITTDHGRGLAQGGNWQHHGSRIPEAGQMWMAAIGPSVKVTGERKEKMQAWQGQIAATIAELLGESFTPAHPVLPPLTLNKKL